MPIDSTKDFKPINVSVLTISDTRTEATDKSGQILAKKIKEKGHVLAHKVIVKDEKEEIKKILLEWCNDKDVDVILTTGGTGLSPRDVTPEATEQVCERKVPGLCEMMRTEGLKKTKNAILSRAVAATRANTLIINLPGSPKAVRESLEAILDILPHAIEMMEGKGH